MRYPAAIDLEQETRGFSRWRNISGPFTGCYPPLTRFKRWTMRRRMKPSGLRWGLRLCRPCLWRRSAAGRARKNWGSRWTTDL